MADSFNVGVDEDDIENLLEVVAEEWIDELLELEHECIAEEAREKETAGEEKEEPHPKIPSEGFSRSFC